MPIHDWTRVGAGIFHHFRHSWIEEIKRALNSGLLPPDYYALAERTAGETSPDRTEMDQYALKQSTLVVRHSSGDRIVALVEVVSPGNKASRHGLRSFVEKSAAALYRVVSYQYCRGAWGLLE